MNKIINFEELPILITGYNRPDLLNKILIQIKSTGATKIYISIDGAKADNTLDKRLQSECAELALATANWSSGEVQISNQNLGCKNGMENAINWFFRKVPFGVILEDDISIHPQALEFFKEALVVYKNESSIGSISGFNPIPRNNSLFSRNSKLEAYLLPIPMLWGWATWADRWQLNKQDLTTWRADFQPKKLRNIGGKSAERFWSKKFDSVAKGFDTWDYGVLITHLKHDLKCVVPIENLTTNFGFRDDATHTKKSHVPVSLISKNQIDVPNFRWPFASDYNKSYYSYIRKNIFNSPLLVEKLFARIVKLLSFSL